MPLPKIATPTYELVLPSTGKKIKYRPFLVKEEEVLVLALESEDITQITNAIKAILKDCISTRIKVDNLPTFDIEYLFLNIRAKSVGEALDLVVTCPDDNETTVPVKIYIDEIEVLQDEDHSTDISLDGNLTNQTLLTYQFIDAFPVNINAVPLTYEGSSITQVSVGFNYLRHTVSKHGAKNTNTIGLF